MVKNIALSLKQAFDVRVEGARAANPEIVTSIYEELAIVNFALVAWLSNSPIVSGINIFSAITGLALAAFCRAWPVRVRAATLAFIILITITIDSWLYGGLNSLFMVWYLAVPLPLLLVLGVGAMLASFGVIGFLVVTTWLVEKAGWLAALPSPGSHMDLALVSIAMMMVTVLSLPSISHIVLKQILRRRRLRNKELLETQQNLLLQQRQQDDFVTSISHELRTPMNAILGFLQAFELDQMAHQPNREMFKVMDHSARHLLTVINDLLDFSQIQSGKLRISPKPMSLHDLLRDATAMFDVLLRERGISLDLWIAPDLPDKILGDSDRITQVIINLLGNAAKFTKSGKVSLRAMPIDGQRLRIEVQDTGCGIAPEQMETVFDRFSTLTDSTRREYGGTGLGLSISQTLVRLMGGHIGVESVLNQGSTFWFELPALPTKALSTGPDKHYPAHVPILTDEANVLIVDDSPINRVVARQMIQKVLPKFQVIEAESGRQAIELLKQHPVDLILMDVVMPDMDGIETAIQINRTTINPPRILGLTADVTKCVHEACIEAGMLYVLTKPYTQAGLIAQIQKALQINNPTHRAHASQ